jgi:hypothetical protein
VEGDPLSLMKSSKKIEENIRAERRLTIDEFFSDDDEVQDAVMTWLREQAGDF